MNLGLKGKIAIVGGSSKGLGLGCALKLAQEGVNITICSNDESSLIEASRLIKKTGVEVLALNVDMSSKEDNERVVNETMERFKKVDILINNSGGPPPGSFSVFSDKEWEVAFNSVLMYVIRLCGLVLPHMKRQKWGRIINLTSLTVKEPSENLILSNVFRSGVVSMAKTISRNLIKENITVNNICPGAFRTDRVLELMKNTAERKNTTVEAIEAEAIRAMPLGRYQHPEELGCLVAFLCSELAGGITGTTLQIDGGISKGLF